MSQIKQEDSLLKKGIKLFAIGFIGLTVIGWIEAKVRGNLSNEVENYEYKIVELVVDKSSVNKKNDQGETALHIAVKTKNRQLVEMLISKGADINATTNIKATPLHYGAAFANKDIITTLVQAGADINAIDNENFKPLDWATKTKKGDNAQLLKSLSLQNITQK